MESCFDISLSFNLSAGVPSTYIVPAIFDNCFVIVFKIVDFPDPFGPISVAPAHQRRGYGKMLIEHSLGVAAEMGYEVVVIFGNPDNYVARGFKSSRKYNVCLEGDRFPAALLVKELKDGALDGRRWYFHESSFGEACADEEAAAAFDATFPPKEKRWQPSQEEFYIHSHSSIDR